MLWHLICLLPRRFLTSGIDPIGYGPNTSEYGKTYPYFEDEYFWRVCTMRTQPQGLNWVS